jgi:cell division ATPase FtsA
MMRKKMKTETIILSKLKIDEGALDRSNREILHISPHEYKIDDDGDGVKMKVEKYLIILKALGDHD